MKSITLKLLAVNIVVMLVFALVFFTLIYSRTNERIIHLLDQQASLALQFELSIRQYAADFIRPAMYELTGEDEFYPETMSTSYIARSIFEDVRKKFPDYIIKFSSDNPRNPLNLAGPEELKIIEKFNKEPQLKQWEGEIIIDNKKYLAKFSARRMVPSCSRCHGKPEDAPTSLVERYGDKAGFYRKLGNVLGLDTVAVPLAKVIELRRSEFFEMSFYTGLGIILVLAATTFITRYLIINRLSVISKHFMNVSKDKDYRQIQSIHLKGNDEIGDLTDSFNTMAERLKTSYISLNEQVDQRTIELQNEINEHKQSEERLRQSEEKFRTAFQTSPNVITLTSVEDGVYVDINDAFTSLLGYDRNEVVGKSSIELNIWKDPKDRERVVAGLEKYGIVETLEAQFKGKQGQVIDGLMSARVLEIEDKKYLLGVTQDITELKKFEMERLDLEIKLQQAHKMEAIGTLAGGIAHDFNNILSGIFGYTQLAQTHMKKPEKAKEYMNHVRNGAQRAAELVQQILTFSRQAEYQKRPLEISAEVEETLKLLRASIPATIDFKIKLESNALVSADPTKIHQVVMNLCTNAYHSMSKKGGVLTLSLIDTEITEPKMVQGKNVTLGSYIRLKISDTGHGMDKETLKKATEPYFTTKETGQGTGLGLALVKAIVDEHEGFLEVHSKVDKGTSIFIYLPTIVENTIHEAPIYQENKSLNGSEKIMIVDDEEAIRDIMKEFLKSLGYQVYLFGNGSEALNAFQSNPDQYDLVITDMTMPELPGDKLAEEILKISPDLPIMLCTGYSENMTEDELTELGIKKIFQKPFENSELAFEIRKVFDGVNE